MTAMRYGTTHGRGTDTSRHRWSGPRHQFTLERDDDRVTYLKRWWLFDTPLGGICLHRMTAGDARQVVHDHPFGFVSIVLRGGGYIEHRLDPKTMVVKRRRVRRLNFVRRSDAHYIESLSGPVVWTLLITSENRRTWGFLEPVIRLTNWAPNEDRTDTVPDGYTASHGEWTWTHHENFDSGHSA